MIEVHGSLCVCPSQFPLLDPSSSRLFSQDQLNEAVTIALAAYLSTLGLHRASRRGVPAGAGSNGSGGSWGSNVSSNINSNFSSNINSSVRGTPSTPSLGDFVSGDEEPDNVHEDDEVPTADQV